MKKSIETDEKLEMEPVNMYVLFAKMFGYITQEVESSCGEKGVRAVREGVRKFGIERGEDIARRANVAGHENDAEHYLSCYDMGRSDYFESEDHVEKEVVEQVFTKCVFAETFQKYHMEKYGIHYCEMIDPAIAEGYCKNFHCIHDKHFFKDGQCHFRFEMQCPEE